VAQAQAHERQEKGWCDRADAAWLLPAAVQFSTCVTPGEAFDAESRGLSGYWWPAESERFLDSAKLRSE
jgi:hypothetical protein